MLKFLGLRRQWRGDEQPQHQDRALLAACSLRPRTQRNKSSHHSSSAGDVSKVTVETSSSIDGGDSRSVSSDDEISRNSTGTGHTDFAADYGLLPSVYNTPGFQEKYQRNNGSEAKSFVTIPTLVRNASKVLSALRNELQVATTKRTEKEDVKWWNFDSENVQEEEQIAFFDNHANYLPVDATSGEDEDSEVDQFDGSRGRLRRSPLLLTAVLEEGVDEQNEEDTAFPPRRDKDKRVVQKQIHRQDDAMTSSTGVLGACVQLVTIDHAMSPIERSFQHLKVMSPEDFDTCSLSSMVYSVDAEHLKHLKHFKERTNASVVSTRSTASVSSESMEVSSVLNIDRYTIKRKKNTRVESLRNRLSSTFRSKSGKKNVSYSLSKGKNGMSKHERVFASALLPTKPLLSRKERTMTSSVVPRSIPQLFDQPLSILLLNPVLKVFEIVLVDFFRDTTIGDALSKARAAATDDALAGQKYVSLCNRKLELAAPMLPVSLLVDTARDRDRDRPLLSSEKRKLMEQRLLVAVPAGSSAKDCQHIRRVLWKNPRVQRWWNRSDPFSHPDESDAEDDDDALYNAADLVIDQPQPVNPVPVQSSCRPRHRNLRYQSLVDEEE